MESVQSYVAGNTPSVERAAAGYGSQPHPSAKVRLQGIAKTGSAKVQNATILGSCAVIGSVTCELGALLQLMPMGHLLWMR